MKAISLWQPYLAGVFVGDGWCSNGSIGLRCSDEDFARTFASAIFDGYQIAPRCALDERGWAACTRTDLVICSSKKKLDEVAYSVARMHGYLKDFAAVEDEMKFGVAVCVVDVLRMARTENFATLTATESLEIADGREYSLGNYEPGRWAWVTGNLRRLRNPVPVVGRQGIWNLPPDTEDKVWAEIDTPAQAAARLRFNMDNDQ